MKKLSRTTITIFVLSFFVIYVKFLKIEDQLVSLFVQDLNATAKDVNAENAKIAKTAAKNVGGQKTSTEKGKGIIPTTLNSRKAEESYIRKKKEEQEASKKKSQFDEATSFETINLNNVTLDTAREIVNLRALRDTEFFDQAVTNISENKLDAKINELKTLVNELQKVQESINKQLKRKEKMDSDSIENLIRVIESMNPKQAANMFAGLNLDTRVLLIKRMDQAKLSSIISLIDPKIATETFERALQKE